uniref:Leucine-rich repeat domain-containing protein n=1 Tax=Rhabditophanes sp. KR3021 TaxID=114890 RepID=A0AC35UCN4_9BILA
MDFTKAILTKYVEKATSLKHVIYKPLLHDGTAKQNVDMVFTTMSGLTSLSAKKITVDWANLKEIGDNDIPNLREVGIIRITSDELNSDVFKIIILSMPENIESLALTNCKPVLESMDTKLADTFPKQFRLNQDNGEDVSDRNLYVNKFIS